MTEQCFDEGTIQAFLDGELEIDSLESVARHTAACESCGLLLQEAENESAFAFSVLGEEFNSLVPTERIRTGLYDAIAQIEKPRKSVWQTIFGGGFSFTNPSVAAFASLALVAGLFTTLYIHRESQKANTPALAVNQPAKSVASPKVSTPSNPTFADDVAAVEKPEVSESPRVPAATYRSERVAFQPKAENVAYKTPIRNPRPESRSVGEGSPTLLGEESYVKTIATLSDTINNRKDEVLRPSEQVAFARDLAVVDDAITKMQQAVRRNPKNEAAKQVLRSSYQNKIDLLNSVAEKTEYMATLR